MALIQKTLFPENLDRYNVFVEDTSPNSRYFNITELPDTFTGGKNAFLIAGAAELVADTVIKIEIKDAAGNIIYHEPGEGYVSSSLNDENGKAIISEYYEGVSKVVAVYVYPGDTAYGPCTITILGELSSYYDNNGLVSPIPLNWEGQYNVKWQKTINVNPTLANTTKIRFYRRPTVSINELISPVYRIENNLKINTGINQSFANIKLSDLETFAGDVKRIKVFRTSLGDISDYDMIQDILVESKELLTTYGLTGSVVGQTGIFTSETLDNFWNTGSLNVSLTNDKIESGLKLNGSGILKYSSSLDLKSTNTYELNLDGFYSSSTASNLGIYISGSDGGDVLIGTLNGIPPTKNLLDTIIPFKLDSDFQSGSLYFSQSQGEWHLGNISLRLSEDTAFSPDEVSFVTTMPTVVGNEDFNFKFEFYDVNNNYVPVLVTGSANFTGGSNAITKLLTFESDRTAFRFSTGSFANPPNQFVSFKTQKTNFTGSITYSSSSFDIDGNYIEPSSYAGTYPGLFTSQNDNGALLSIANFSGSVSDIIVGSITYTASCEGFQEFETIYRFEDGDNAPGVFVTSNTNQFIYKATDLSLNPSGQIITIEAKRKNLASATTALTVNSGSEKPPLTFVSTNATNGVDTYTIAGTSYPYGTGETTYFISGSDQFGNEFSDAIKITPVKILDGLSATLTNDNASLPALSNGFVASGSFLFTSGSVNVKVGNETITFDDDNDGNRANNTFAITDVSGLGCTPSSTNPSENAYSITSLSADSGSLNITIDYKDGAGDSTSLIKNVTYTKNKKASPVLTFVIGNNNQSTDAKSTGEQLTSFSDSTLSVKEQYNGASSTLTLSSAPTINSSSAFADITKTTTNLSYPTMASATDSVELSITGSVTDSEGVSRQVFGNVSLTKVKKAVPSVTISATPQSQTVAANAAGTQTGALANVTISALEGTTDRFTSMVIAGTSGFSTAPIVSDATLTMTSAVMNADEASVTLTVTHTDSEGTTGQTQTITIRASKIKQGESGVVVNLNPASQVVTRNNTGTYGTPATFVVSVVEGATTYTYDGTSPYAVSTFRISDLVGGTNSNGTITPTTPTTISGTLVSFNVIYVNAAGTSVTIPQTHQVSVTLDGQTGPGVVFTGNWETGRAYQFSAGAGTGRRDVVLYPASSAGTYYAATVQHTSTPTGVTGPPTVGTYWESLGAQDFFVAAKIGLFEDSYVQSTLNIGTNNNGGVSSANITLAGGTTNPYLSIGQATQGYENDGVFLGRSSNVAKFSIVNGTTSFLKWTGTELQIKGSLNFTNQASVDLSGFGGFTSLSGSVNTAQLVANTATSSAATAQTTATNAATVASNAGTVASNAQSSATTAINNLQAVVNGNSTLTGTFINDSFIYSPAIAGDAGYFDEIFRVGANGITLDGTNKSIYVGEGTYNNANTPFYFKSGSTDIFSLGSKLSFNGNTLLISGLISGSAIEGGTITGGSILGSTLVGGSISVPNSTNPLFQVNSSGIMTATDANISGQITATSGLLGNWVVDPPAAGGSLKDNTGRIVLNPTDKRISMFNSSGELKAQINADDTLSTIGAGNIYVYGIGTSTSAPSGPTSNAGNSSLVFGTPVYSDSATFTIPTSGEYQLSDLFSTYSPPPTINLASKISSLGSISVSTGNPYGYVTPTYPGDYYSSNAYGRAINQILYFVVENDSTGVEIAAIQIATANARGAYSLQNSYYATDTSNTSWQYTSGYSSAGNSWSSTTTPPITSVVNFPSAGTYRVRYKSVMSAQSGYQYYLNGTSETGVYSYFTVSGIGGVALSSLDGAVNFNKPANFIEMSGGGFQAVTNSDQFVKINRENVAGDYGVILLQVEGGKTVLNQDVETDTVLYASGRTSLIGRIDLGSSFYSGDFYDPIAANIKVPYLSGLVQESRTIVGPGVEVNPTNLAYYIADGDMQIWLNWNSNTSRYYALPNQLSNGTYEPTNSAQRLPVGTTLFLFNKTDANSVFIRGLLPNSTGDGYYQLAGGTGIIVVYTGSSSVSDPTQSYKWIIYSSFDNTW